MCGCVTLIGSRSHAGEGGGSSRASNGGSGIRRKRNEPKTKTEAQLEKIRYASTGP